MKFPNVDVKTHKRLLSKARSDGPTAVGELASEMLSAVIAFMIGSMGPEATALILRDWAANIQRREIKVANEQ